MYFLPAKWLLHRSNLRKANREAGGLAPQDVPPVYHSTDTYIKHRKLLQDFWQRKFGVALDTISDTPRSDARTLAPSALQSPTKNLACK